MIKISDFLDVELLEPDLYASDTEDCLRKIVVRLSRCHVIKDGEDVLEKLLEREKVMSTGIGAEVAIPHARCPSLSRTIVSVAISREGVDFHSIDGNPVKVIFLIIGPPEAASLHIKLLAQIARMIKNEGFTERLSRAKTAAEIVKVIEEKEMKEAKEDGVE
ncbi:MAG: PTS sugar transporter subunit IIA [Acidobacteriota bacterium]